MPNQYLGTSGKISSCFDRRQRKKQNKTKQKKTNKTKEKKNCWVGLKVDPHPMQFCNLVLSMGFNKDIKYGDRKSAGSFYFGA